jgi:GNAT superfamily N-acetyltransferase
VHPDEVTPALWKQVLAGSGTGRFLPSDKDARWGGEKQEDVVAVTGEGSDTRVTTLLRRGSGTVKVFCYGDGPDVSGALDDAAKTAADHGAARARVLWFGSGHDPRSTGFCRILLKAFSGDEEPRAHGRVGSLAAQALEVQATWRAFATAMSGEGFGFLAERMHEGREDGPVLVAVASGRVVGAIGPMAILPDSRGRARLLPQYFGVLPEYRGHGYGRALWRAAMRWGADNGAAYQLLQTGVDGASDRLCLSEGLRCLAVIHAAEPR